MNRALVGTLESAPPGTPAVQLRERLRAPVVLEQLRRADPECAAAVEHQDADAFVEYLLRAQEPPEGGDVAIEPDELYTGDPDPEEAGLGDVLGSAALPDWLSDLPADGDLGAMQVHLQEKLSSDFDLLALLAEEAPAEEAAAVVAEAPAAEARAAAPPPYGYGAAALGVAALVALAARRRRAPAAEADDEPVPML